LSGLRLAGLPRLTRLARLSGLLAGVALLTDLFCLLLGSSVDRPWRGAGLAGLGLCARLAGHAGLTKLPRLSRLALLTRLAGLTLLARLAGLPRLTLLTGLAGLRFAGLLREVLRQLRVEQLIEPVEFLDKFLGDGGV
jgi:hypothetical protein